MSEKPLNANEHLTPNQLKAANVSVGMSRESGTKQDKLISMSVVMLDYRLFYTWSLTWTESSKLSMVQTSFRPNVGGA